MSHFLFKFGPMVLLFMGAGVLFQFNLPVLGVILTYWGITWSREFDAGP